MVSLPSPPKRGDSPSPESIHLGAVLPAVATATSASLPVFLVGASSVQLMAAFHIGPATIGLLGALYSAAGATASIPLSRLTNRLGPSLVMAAANVSAAALIGLVAVGVGAAWQLGVVLLAAGVVSATAQPAINVYLSRFIPRARQGTAFGVKQASVPTATLLAGALVPLVVLNFGWRWAFATAAVGAALLAVLPLRLARSTRSPGRPPPHHLQGTPIQSKPLFLLALAFGLGIAAASCLGTFLIPSGVAAGLPKASAADAAIAASISSLTARLALGVHADHSGRGHLKVVAGMLVAGSVGFSLLAVAGGQVKDLLFMGAILSYGAGWGWNGLFNYAVVKYHPQAAAKATAVTQAGGRLGGIAGPLVFGAIAADRGYGAAWFGCAIAALAAAAMMLAGRRALVGALEADKDDDLVEELAFPS